MRIDTHCHLNKEDYENIDEVIKRMGNNIMIVSGDSKETNKQVIELCNKYDNVYGTIGYHPNSLDEYNEKTLLELMSQAKHNKIVAIGEIGLDYHYDNHDKEKQQKAFIEQIKIAKELNKPIVIHSRDAGDDTYKILNDEAKNLKIIMHCYSYSLEFAKQLLKFNIMFGIGGVVTFKNGVKLKKVVEEIDLEKLLLETDSPYLSPEPLRGQKNEPYNTLYIAEEIAKIKGISLEEVEEITTKNAISQFDLPI